MTKKILLVTILMLFWMLNCAFVFANETGGGVSIRKYEESRGNTVLWDEGEKKLSVYDGDSLIYSTNIGSSVMNTDTFSLQLDYEVNTKDGFAYLKEETLENINEICEKTKIYDQGGKCTIVEKKFENIDKNICVNYPEIQNYKGELLQDYMNQSIFQLVKQYIDNDMYESLMLDYSIQRCDDEYISILFTGKASIMPFLNSVNIMDSITLDLATSNELSVEKNIKDMNQLSNVLQENSLRKLEYEQLKFFFNDDKVVFYYKPLDDSKNLYDMIVLDIDALQGIMTLSADERPAS